MKCGLLYLSQESCLVGEVSYHSYEGILIEGDERDRIAKNLGVHNKVMMLRNHGAVCCGESVEEAFFYAYHLVLAADAQLKMVPLGVDNLITIPEETRQKVTTEENGDSGQQFQNFRAVKHHLNIFDIASQTFLVFLGGNSISTQQS